ncbi:MAG: Vi polysaccharide biosynthesis UDP-N-acetylglucosamine C-6 dehydrogenase TviB, partial [Proteobacteria bacterium]|nr:Vi polysaccharide biosynthesis UDP-N-acetylglucosamine C-6 dehydrogenase TviB [Pseudomonadota bacterium]
ENMSNYVTERILKLMALNKMHVLGAKILVMGVTFKENCPDLRNTRVIEIVDALKNYHAEVDVCDPWADHHQAKSQLGIELVSMPEKNHYDMVLLAVSHHEFTDDQAPCVRGYLKDNGLIFDLKGALPKEQVDERL